MIFYLLFFLVAALALATVFTPHIFRSAIYLMGVLSLSAGLYLLLGAEFLAGIQVLVYVGGILVLLVFAIMLTQSQDLLEDHPDSRRKLLAGISATMFFTISSFALSSTIFRQDMSPSLQPSPVASIGKAFLSTNENGYIVPFELISILLLAVLIAGVVLARKENT